jgi:hypothetical protein
VVSAGRPEGGRKAFGRRFACGPPSVEFSAGGWNRPIWSLKAAEKASGRRPGCSFTPVRTLASFAQVGIVASRPTSRRLRKS